MIATGLPTLRTGDDSLTKQAAAVVAAFQKDVESEKIEEEAGKRFAAVATCTPCSPLRLSVPQSSSRLPDSSLLTCGFSLVDSDSSALLHSRTDTQLKQMITTCR